jgi:hypothetical protein
LHIQGISICIAQVDSISYLIIIIIIHGAVAVMLRWYLDLQLHVPGQSVPITSKIVSSNAAHDEVYSMQQYVIKFVSDLWQFGGFLDQ